MNILIVGFAKIKYMPYLRFYTDAIARDANVEVLYWNRDLREEDLSDYGQVTFHEFRAYQEDNVSRVRKIKSFLRFRAFARRILKTGAYDRVICLHTFPALLLSDVLRRRYKGRYIFDYRDYTYEGFWPFRRAVNAIARSAKAVFVSSDAYRRVFSEDLQAKVYTSHNVSADACTHRSPERIPSDKIRMAFWGFIRHEALNRCMIEQVAADPRFELHYYGREQQIAQRLKAFAEDLHADNVFFHGEYVPQDRYAFARVTDLIHNVYDDENTKMAMGNKYYDGILFAIAQLCMVNTFMGDMVTEKGIGQAVDPYKKTFLDEVYAYYHALQPDAFRAACDEELKRVMNEYEYGRRVIRDATGDKKDI